MCLELRKTLRRGRSALPTTLLRTWRRRRSWRRCLVFCWSISGVLLAASDLRRPAGERLALFAANLFAFVHDALALVRLRFADCADLGGKLPDLLLVRTLDHDCVHVGDFDRYSIGRCLDDGVGIADHENDRFLFELGLIADAFDLQALFVSFGDAEDHIVDQGASQAVQGAVEAFVVWARHFDRLSVGLDLHVGMRFEFEFALGAFDANLAAVEVHLDAGGYGDRLFTDT